MTDGAARTGAGASWSAVGVGFTVLFVGTGVHFSFGKGGLGTALPGRCDRAPREALAWPRPFPELRIGASLSAGTVVLPGAILETSPQAWDTMMATNARSVFLCSRAVVPHMLQRGSGRIVNIASTAGLRLLPDRAADSASKHAVVGFTRALALELRPHGIAVNAICPGAVDTPLTAYSRPEADRSGWLRPPDVADVAVFLASDAARGMTGAVVEVSGWAD